MTFKILLQITVVVLVPIAAVYGRPSVSRQNDGKGNFGYKYDVSHYPGNSRGHFNSGRISSNYQESDNAKQILVEPKNSIYTPHQGSPSEHLSRYYNNQEESPAIYKEENQGEIIYEPRSIYPPPYDSAAKNLHNDDEFGRTDEALGHGSDYSAPSHGVPLPEARNAEYISNQPEGRSHSRDYVPYQNAHNKPHVPQEHITVGAPQQHILQSKPQNYEQPPLSQELVDQPLLQEPIDKSDFGYSPTHLNSHVSPDHINSPIYQKNVNQHIPQQYTNPSPTEGHLKAPHYQEHIDTPISQGPIEPPIAQDHTSSLVSQDHIELPISQEYIEPSIPQADSDTSIPYGVNLPISQDHIDPPISQELVPLTVPEYQHHSIPASPSGIKTISQEPKYRFVPSGPPHVTDSFTTQIIHPPLPNDQPSQSLELSQPLSPPHSPDLPTIENINPPPISHAFRLQVPFSSSVAETAAIDAEAHNDNHHVSPVSHATRHIVPSATIPKEESVGNLLHSKPQENFHTPVEALDSDTDVDGLEFPEFNSFHSESPDLSQHGPGPVLPPISHAFKLILPVQTPPESKFEDEPNTAAELGKPVSNIPRVSHAFRLNIPSSVSPNQPLRVPEVDYFDELSSFENNNVPYNPDDSGLLAVESKNIE